MEIKKTNILANMLELSIEDETNDLPKEVLAAISKNPTLKWIKFVLTDDAPNANNQRIPKEEFSNITKTGLHMPIKMAQGFIREGHEYSVPIGSITSLIARDNRVEGIAGLWSKEFPEEVELLQEMTASEEKPQLSWELLYHEASKDEDDVDVLQGVSLSAATIVGMPAYEGRTPIVLMAAKKDDESEANYTITMEDNETMEELERLQKRVSELETSESELKASLKEKEDALAELQAQFDSMSSEKEELAEFKAEVEAEREKKEKLEGLKKLFSDAGIELPDEYLENEEKQAALLAMDLTQVEFLIQELALFASSSEEGEEEEAEASEHLGSKTRLNLKGPKDEDVTPSEVAKFLKERTGEKDE